MGFQCYTQDIVLQEFENSFCSVVCLVPRQSCHINLLDFCLCSLMLDCSWIPLKGNAIVVPIFFPKKWRNNIMQNDNSKLRGWDTQELSWIFRLFWIPIKSLLKIKLLVPEKILKSKIWNPKKSFEHPCHLKSGVPPPLPPRPGGRLRSISFRRYSVYFLLMANAERSHENLA